MSLDQYKIKSQENRWNEEYGVEEWVLVFAIPNNRVQAEQINFRVSMANLLPGCDQSDVYAPCINASALQPDAEDPGGQLLRVTYRRPPASMILQPGRGLLSFGTYTTTRTTETAEFIDGREVIRQIANVGKGAAIGSWTSRLEKRKILKIEERGTVTVRCADWAAAELDLYARAASWIGKGGKLVINGVDFAQGGAYPAIKCAQITIERRAADASVVESSWVFARKADGFRTSGEQLLSAYAVDLSGNAVSYDWNTGLATDSDGNKLRAGQFLVTELNDKDADAISGIADFAAMGDYFKWMK